MESRGWSHGVSELHGPQGSSIQSNPLPVPIVQGGKLRLREKQRRVPVF